MIQETISKQMDKSRTIFVILALLIIAIGSVLIAQAAESDSKDGDVIRTVEADSKDEDVIRAAESDSKEGDVIRGSGKQDVAIVAENVNPPCPIAVPYYQQTVEEIEEWSTIPTIPYATQSDFYSNMSTTNGTSTARNDYSGVTHDIVSDSLLIVDNKDDAIDVYDENDQLINTITVGFVNDLEDIAWMWGDEYVLVDEATNKLHIVSIPDIEQTASLGTSDIVYTINTCLPHDDDGNDGIEGVAVALWSVGTNATFFYVAWEGEDEGSDPQIYEYRRFRDNDNDETNNPVYQFGPLNLGNVVEDVAAIYTPLSDINTLYVLSEKSKQIVRLNSFYLGQVTGTFSLANFSQPEGLYFDLMMNEMYVVGEDRQLGRYTP